MNSLDIVRLSCLLSRGKVSFVASGFTGIGRKSYMLECLKRSKIIEEYYMPPSISLNNLESIEDIIVKLSEIGFGNYSLSDVAIMPDMKSKISSLNSIFKSIQNYKEQVVIYDDGCLINLQGELVYWLREALIDIRNEVTVLIASKNDMIMYSMGKNENIFTQPLSSLSYSEWNGLMRVYGKACSIELTVEDREYFRDIITGYPPQVKYCVDLMKSSSIEEVKKAPRQVIDAFSSKITEMLNSAIPDKIKEDAYGLLAFSSSYGIVPNDLLLVVIKIKKNYEEAFSLFKILTICRYLGISREYIEVNPLISDYVQRSRFKLPLDIRNVLQKRLNEFNQIIEGDNNILVEDFENLRYYLKSNIIEGKDIPNRFMYSTLYLSSIYELYNRQKYKQVINIIKKLKETRSFERYDIPVQMRMQGFYCRALAREGQLDFYVEVEFFVQNDEVKNINEYNFLRGFMFRHNSEYDKALDRYKQVLAKQPKHKSAMKEIVIVYRGLEDYESAYEYAKSSYLRDPENPYQIQSYFEILIRRTKKDRNQKEAQYISDMLETIKRIDANKPSATYYEIFGQYAAYEERNKERAVAFFTEGIKKFPDSSYLVKALFDCSEFFHDEQSMKNALDKLEKLATENKAVKVVFSIRQMLLYAYKRKPIDFIYNSINSIVGLNEEAKERLRKRIKIILDSK